MNQADQLHLLGWDERFEASLAEDPPDARDEIGRVVTEHYGGLEVVLKDTRLLARVTGLLRREIARNNHPRLAVGDFVVLRPRRQEGTAAIVSMVPRRSVLLRRMPGSDDLSQPVCANIAQALIVVSAAEPPNVRRLERFLSLCAAGNVRARLVLAKADLVDDPEAVAAAYRSTLGDVSIVSIPKQQGLAELAASFEPRQSYALIGPSGVGKTTLTNYLLGGTALATAAVREDGKGRHTTTSRQLVIAPSGALFIDTPGLREVGLIAESAVDGAFVDVSDAARRCRFSDCRHEEEPDCAVREGLADKSLTQQRVDAFKRLSEELVGGGSRRPERMRKR